MSVGGHNPYGQFTYQRDIAKLEEKVNELTRELGELGTLRNSCNDGHLMVAFNQEQCPVCEGEDMRDSLRTRITELDEHIASIEVHNSRLLHLKDEQEQRIAELEQKLKRRQQKTVTPIHPFGDNEDFPHGD